MTFVLFASSESGKGPDCTLANKIMLLMLLCFILFHRQHVNNSYKYVLRELKFLSEFAKIACQ